MNKQQFNNYIAQIVQIWAQRLNAKLLTAMAAQGLFKTGDLQQSLNVKVLAASVGLSAQVHVSFNSYGRVLDIKKRPQRMPTDNNTTRRIAVGVGSTRRDQGRAWYNRTWWKETETLSDALFGNVLALSDEAFLNWVEQ